jgi:hypothetical protein
MTRKHVVTTLKGFLFAGAVAAGLASTPARAGLEISFSPSAGFVATSSPVYYEGHAAYWYGNRWQYREGGQWRSYREEPSYLRESRSRGEPSRQYYGRGRAGRYGRR